MNYSLIFKLPLHWWLALTFASSELSFVLVERLGVLTSVLLPQDLLSGFLFCFSDVWGWGFLFGRFFW